MPFLVTCPRCKRKLKIGDGAVGKQIKCSSCGAVFAARASAPAPSQEEYESKPEKAAITRCACPSCHTTMKLAAPAPTGKRIKCPRCATVFPVSEKEAPVPAASRTGAPAGDEGASPHDRDRTAGTRRRAASAENIADKADQDYEEEPEERAPRRRRAGKGKQRKASLALRVSALILGLIGGLFSGGLGLAWRAQASSPEVKAMRDFAAAVANETGSKELKENLARLDRMVRSSYFLLLAAPLGIAGGVLALLGRMKLGGTLMLAAVPIPLILNVVTLMPLYFLLVGGLLAVLTPSWPPGGGPSTVVMALLTTGGWVAVFIVWVVLILALPKPTPEVKAGPGPAAVPPGQRGGMGVGPGGPPAAPAPGPALIPSPQPPSSPAEPATPITAEQLGKEDLEKGEPALDDQYRGKTLRVSGKVESVLDNFVYLGTGLKYKEGLPIRIVMIMRDPAEAQKLRMKAGTMVVIEGRYDGAGVSGPSFKQCRLVKKE